VKDEDLDGEDVFLILKSRAGQSFHVGRVPEHVFIAVTLGARSFGS